MKFYIALLVFVMVSSNAVAQSVQGIEVYELSALRGQQIFYASHIKPEHMKNSKLIDDEDRAAFTAAIGKTGIAMPRLPTPIVDNECRVQDSKMKIITIKDKDGQLSQIAKLEHNAGQDDYIVFKGDDTIRCLLIDEGVTQIYTIHLNVTFPDGAKLVTLQTTRNRPLGVSTLTTNGKAVLSR
jgi:hypothetical protein